MRKSYTVAAGMELNYPADPTSKQIVKDMGGRSKLTPDQKSLVSFKHVKEGDDCSDLDPEIITLYLSRGYILEREIPDPVTEKTEIKEIKSKEEEEGVK